MGIAWMSGFVSARARKSNQQHRRAKPPSLLVLRLPPLVEPERKANNLRTQKDARQPQPMTNRAHPCNPAHARAFRRLASWTTELGEGFVNSSKSSCIDMR